MTTKKALIEGILFASSQPVKASVLAEVLEMELEEVKNELGALQESYASDEHGFWLVLIGGAYQLRTKPELKEVMKKFYAKKPPRLSQAMLEVLSIVAYKQPVIRPEIDRIRGVDSSGALKTLLERELIEMRGRSEGPGNPTLYATTSKFLEWFQVPSLADLPPLSEIEALNVSSDEEAEDLMKLLNREGKITSEDLRDLDSHLQEVARDQKKLQVNIEEPKNEEPKETEAGEKLESPEVQEAAADQDVPEQQASS